MCIRDRRPGGGKKIDAWKLLNAMGRPWASHVVSWGPPGGLLGGSWGRPWALLAAPGARWAPLGAPLAALLVLLAALGTPPGALGASWGAAGSFLVVPGGPLRAFGQVFCEPAVHLKTHLPTQALTATHVFHEAARPFPKLLAFRAAWTCKKRGLASL